MFGYKEPMNYKETEDKILESIDALKNVVKEISYNLAIVLADEEMLRPGQLMPKQAFLERFQQQITNELKKTQERLKSGSKVLLEVICKGSQESKEFLINEFAKFSDLAVLFSTQKELVYEQLSKGQTLQAMAGISKNALEEMYQAAKHLYDEKRFKEAVDAFGFLAILNSEQPTFWFGLANSEFQLQNYQGALFAYAFVARLHPDDFTCHILSCRCYEALDELENARNALELALYVIDDNTEHKELEQNLKHEIKRLDDAIRQRYLQR